MKKTIQTLLSVCAFVVSYGQTGNVGINTPTPAETLDVNGTMRVATTPQVTAATLASHQILAIDNTSKQVKQLDPSLISSGNFNTTIFAAKKVATPSFLNLSLFASNFQLVNFLTSEATAGATNTAFSNLDSSYTIPSTGVYSISYSYRFAEGLQLSLLSGNPGIAIGKLTGTTFTILDSRTFGGVNLLGLVSLTISESHINTLYQLNAGDKIYFGMLNQGGINLGALGSTTASVAIHKISN